MPVSFVRAASYHAYNAFLRGMPGIKTIEYRKGR